MEANATQFLTVHNRHSRLGREILVLKHYVPPLSVDFFVTFVSWVAEVSARFADQRGEMKIK